jgi:hypothetical protein
MPVILATWEEEIGESCGLRPPQTKTVRPYVKERLDMVGHTSNPSYGESVGRRSWSEPSTGKKHETVSEK